MSSSIQCPLSLVSCSENCWARGVNCMSDLRKVASTLLDIVETAQANEGRITVGEAERLAAIRDGIFGDE
jgi:hypothetical protein